MDPKTDSRPVYDGDYLEMLRGVGSKLKDITEKKVDGKGETDKEGKILSS